MLCSALLGCPAYGQPSVSVAVSVPLPTVEIRANSDFYAPLAPQGEWVVVGSYGRCWRPGHVDRDWRPYSEGYWQATADGWYWVSDEPWAWATYHYGRWDFTDEYGWYWVPQIQWAPAWVSWHSGGGYVGWAPLFPSGVRVISPRAYVFVEERHFTEPVRRSALINNNNTLINQATIHERPGAAAIEKASGRKIQQVAVRDLRHQEEAPVAARQRTPAAAGENQNPAPGHSEAQPADRKAVPAHESPQVEQRAATPEPAPKHHEAQGETRPSVPATGESGPGGHHPPTIKEPTGQNANPHPAKPERSAPPADSKAQPAARERPAANDQNGPDPADQNHGNRGRE